MGYKDEPKSHPAPSPQSAIKPRPQLSNPARMPRTDLLCPEFSLRGGNPAWATMKRSWPPLINTLISQLAPEAREQGLSAFNTLLLCAVLVAVSIQVLETEPLLYGPHETWFHVADTLVGIVFVLDVLLRFLVCDRDSRYRGFRGRLRYIRQIRVLIDLLAILPFLICPWSDWIKANDLAFLRLVIAMEILLSARLGRLSLALHALRAALRSRKEEMLLSLGLAFGVMVLTATGLYLVEGQAQPQSFGSIPRALWWSLETLTTVGYGDVLPITVIGKVLAGIAALVGIGIIAIPTGILAASFSQAFQAQQASPDPSPSRSKESAP